MVNNKECEGHTNWETCSVDTWMANDHPTYDEALRRTKAHDGKQDKIANALRRFMVQMEWHPGPAYRDFFQPFHEAGGNLCDVDWMDVAKCWQERLDDLKRNNAA